MKSPNTYEKRFNAIKQIIILGSLIDNDLNITRTAKFLGVSIRSIRDFVKNLKTHSPKTYELLEQLLKTRSTNTNKDN